MLYTLIAVQVKNVRAGKSSIRIYVHRHFEKMEIGSGFLINVV